MQPMQWSHSGRQRACMHGGGGSGPHTRHHRVLRCPWSPDAPRPRWANEIRRALDGAPVYITMTSLDPTGVWRWAVGSGKLHISIKPRRTHRRTHTQTHPPHTHTHTTHTPFPQAFWTVSGLAELLSSLLLAWRSIIGFRGGNDRLWLHGFGSVSQGVGRNCNIMSIDHWRATLTDWGAK